MSCGVDIINDISACDDSKMGDVVARAQVPIILMHRQGRATTMQDNPCYKNVVEEVIAFFNERITFLRSKGVSSFILDPGIGFGKTLDHNLSLIKASSQFVSLGYPVMLGVSRKSFISAVMTSDVSKRLGGGLAASMYGVSQGVDYLRTHDVFETVQACHVWSSIQGMS